jgi:protein-tyrosine phosphatase
VASRDQIDKVLALAPTALRTTFTIREAARIAESLEGAPVPASVDELRARVAELGEHRTPAAPGSSADDIVDPQGKDAHAYVLMARQEVPALARLATTLFGMPRAEAVAYEKAVEAGAYDFDDEGTVATADPAPRPRGRREA